MTKKEFQQVCSKAADVIARDGLLKGDYGTNDGPKCVMGSLRFAANGDVNKHLVGVGELVGQLFQAARPKSKRPNIVSFNDVDRTRKHDVVELLRDMAAV